MTVPIKDLPVTFTREAEIGKLRGTRFSMMNEDLSGINQCGNTT